MSISTEAEAQSIVEPIRPFARLGRDDVAYAGGKGANLGELTSAGLPVPDGFVVGAPAYAAFCAETGLRERLTKLLDEVDVEDTAALQAASTAARELFDETPIPAPLAQEIRSAYEQLVGKDLLEYSRETVQMFHRDAVAAAFSIDTREMAKVGAN